MQDSNKILHLAQKVGNMDTRPEILRVWKSHGRYCVVISNGIGFYCGYVMLELEHPWYNRHYDKIPADVHGGLTYAGERDWLPPDFWIGGDGAPPGFFIGFDTGHFMDAPIPGSYMDESNKEFNSRYPDTVRWTTREWDVASVAAECDSLALQAEVAAVAAAAP